MAAPEPAPTAAPVAVPQPASARPSIDIASTGESNFFIAQSSLDATRCKAQTSDSRACRGLVPFGAKRALSRASPCEDDGRACRGLSGRRDSFAERRELRDAEIEPAVRRDAHTLA